jgi:hypothetical protein
MNITEHFKLSELVVTTKKQFANVPDEKSIKNLHRMCALLEEVRTLVGGKAIHVYSAYRSYDVNKAVGGKPHSQHLTGCAADIWVAGVTPAQLIRDIVLSDLGYDQVIREFDRWVHISVPSVAGSTPRKSKLIIDKTGVRPYIVTNPKQINQQSVPGMI